MARPLKTGIDYFPHTCSTEMEMEVLEAKCGLVGYAVVNKLYERIYAGDGYYCKWSENIEIVFAKHIGIDIKCLQNVLKVAFENDIFSKEMFEKYKILTSKEIQSVYIEVTKKRKKVKFVKEFMLVENCEQIINDAHNTQSKVEESRGNKSKGNESKVEESKQNASAQKVSEIEIPCTDGTYLVDKNEISQLQQLYTKINVVKSIRKIYDYLTSHTDKQRRKANMENRIRLWLEEDNEKASKNSQTDDKSKSTSYDITVFDDIDLFWDC